MSPKKHLIMITSSTNGVNLHHVESRITSLIEGLYLSNATVSTSKWCHLLTYIPVISLKFSFLLDLTNHSKTPSSAIDSSLANVAASTGFSKCVSETDTLFLKWGRIVCEFKMETAVHLLFLPPLHSKRLARGKRQRVKMFTLVVNPNLRVWTQ